MQHNFNSFYNVGEKVYKTMTTPTGSDMVRFNASEHVADCSAHNCPVDTEDMPDTITVDGIVYEYAFTEKTETWYDDPATPIYWCYERREGQETGWAIINIFAF